MKTLKYLLALHIITIFNIQVINSQGCGSISANAGPDQFTCDPSMPIQLMGSTSATMFTWTPETYLSDPSALDPFVNAPPGIYKYILTAKGISTTNLINNGDFEAGNTGFSSSYAYSSDLNAEGRYYVGPDPSATHPGFSPCPDYSGGGNQIIVNASVSAGLSFWCQTVSVIPGKMYIFSFQLQNVVAANPGQINVTFNGASVGNISAGGVCNWTMFEYCFTATTASINICLREMTGIAGGNDFAVDEISMFEKCEDKDEVIVEIVDLKALISIPKIPECSSEPFTLKGNGSSLGANVKWEWSATNGGRIVSTNGQEATGKGSGTYKLKVIYQNGLNRCEKEVEIEVHIDDDLIGEVFTDGEATCNFDTVMLSVNISNGSGNYTYFLSPSSAITRGQGKSTAFTVSPGRFGILVIDKITGCEFEQIFNVEGDTIGPKGAILGDSLITCDKNIALLNANLQDTNKYSFQWILPDKSTLSKTNINSSLTGRYQLIIIDKNTLCSDTSSHLIAENKNIPSFSFGNDLTIDCKNTSVNVQANQTGNGKFIYQWTFPDGSTALDSSLQNKNLAQGGLVILNVKNLINGCDDVDSIMIRDLRKIPSVDAGQNNTITCKNTSITLQGSSNLSNMASVIWKNENGTIINNQNNNIVTISQSGKYFFTVIDSTNFCENTDSVLIDIDQNKPKAIVEADKTFRCADTLVTIDASQSDSGSRLIYRWSDPSGNIVSGNNTKIATVKNAGTFTIVVIDTINGCADSATINIIPDQNKPIATAITNDVLDCDTKEVSLTGTVRSTTGGALQYYWTSTNNSNITDANSLNPKVQTPGTYIFWAVDQMNGCSTSIQTIVTIDTLAPIAFAGLDQEWTCSSKQSSLMALDTASNALNFEWTTQNGNISSSPNNAQINVSNFGTYFLKVTNPKNGCVAFDQVTIKPNLNKPSIALQKPPDLTCITTMVNLTSNGSATGSQYQYTWSTINGSLSGATNQSSTSASKKAFYILTIIDTSNQCISMDSIFVDENIVKPIVDAGLDQVIGCKITTANITANTASQNQKVWSTVNGNIISSNTLDRISVDREGTYILTVTDPVNGCTSSDEVIVTTIKNTPNQIVQNIIQPLCPEDYGAVEILNTFGGTQPFEYYLNNSKVNSNFINDLPAGRYTLKVIDSNGCEFEKTIDIDKATGVSVSIIPEVTLYPNDTFRLKPQYSLPDDSIAWVKWEPMVNLSCYDCLYPIHTADGEQIYTVTFANKNGCTGSDEIKIIVNKRNVWIPNTFTVNGDQLNDRFFPFASNGAVKQVKFLSIYDRWGEKLFHLENFPANNPNVGWDGTFRNNYCNPGVYVYVIEIEWNNGETQKFIGDVTLLK